MVESGLQWSENSPEGEVNEEVERVKNAMVRCILIEALSKMAEREALEKNRIYEEIGPPLIWPT
jgi:hypothetical protein